MIDSVTLTLTLTYPTTSQTWKKTFIEKLTKHLAKYNMDPKIKSLLVQALAVEIEDTPHGKRAPEHQFQLESQLTWKDMIQGRVNIYFTRIQEDYRKKKHPKSKDTGQRWTKRLIVFIWHELYNQWKIRCTKQHDKDGKIQDAYLHNEATSTIKTYYQYGPRLLAADRNKWLAQDLDDLLQSDTYTLRRWIATNEVALKRAIADAERYPRTHCKDIRSYFQDWIPP